MLVFTTRLTRRGLAAAVILAGALLCGIILLAARLGAGPRDAVESTPTPRDIHNNEDRVAYLESFGWRVEPQPLEVQEVRIPDEFDAILQNYNEIQLSQGFDLSRHKGKRVMRYRYEILNHPQEAFEVYADLLVDGDTVIGSDVHTAELDGFMAGLTRPDADEFPGVGGGAASPRNTIAN
ncbi:MAG: DUF4830 domain-containing protein [Oscillospiraceae bacterium]|jgi:hypothetical protein|nr:DUF4830 domain-containing protein [Oscillospiraceae bacterium]